MNPQFKLEILASVVAWYGAIVATAGFVLSLFNSLRDKAHIKIQYQPDMEVVGPGPYSPGKTYFSVTVINKGRRPANITKAGLRIIGGKRKHLIFSDSFSGHRTRVLTEESPVTEFLVEQDLVPFDKAWYIWVTDATGNIYKRYFHKLPTLWLLWYKLKWNNASIQSAQQGAATDK